MKGSDGKKAHDRLTAESRIQTEVLHLKESLESARASRSDALQELEDARTCISDLERSVSSLRETVENLELDKAEVSVLSSDVV